MDIGQLIAGPFGATMLGDFGAEVIKVEQPGIGTASILGVPFSLSDSPPNTFSAAPELGQHTDEVLSELGLDANAIARLRTAKTVA